MNLDLDIANQVLLFLERGQVIRASLNEACTNDGLQPPKLSYFQIIVSSLLIFVSLL